MIIGRKAELEWIQRQSGLSRLILINGVRGVGKSKLIREWLKQNQTNFTWITVERFKSLAQILNRSGSMESALEEAAKSWQNVDLVIWDEIHLLAPNIRQFIFSFLRNSPYLPLQIFLSDEDLEMQSLDLDLAQQIGRAVV